MRRRGFPRQRTYAFVLAIATGVSAAVSCGLAAGGPAAPASSAGSATSPVFAPDGSAVAFALVTEAATRIAVVPATGGSPRPLAAFRGRADVVQWFPDGTGLLVQDGEDGPGVWRVPIDGSAKQRLAKGENPRLSPDGKTLACLAPDHLHLTDLASGRATAAASDRATAAAAARATAAAPGSDDGWRMGDWLDADTLVALSGDGGLVLVRRASPGGPKVLVPHKSMSHCFVAAAVCAKRRLIAATSDDMQHADPANPSSIWVFDASGRPVGGPIPNASRPTWSAAGTLFFVRRGEILMTEDFQAVRSLGLGETVTASPDGALLVIGRRDADTNGDGTVNWLDACRLYRVPIHNGKAEPPQPLLTSPGAEPGSTHKAGQQRAAGARNVDTRGRRL